MKRLRRSLQARLLSSVVVAALVFTGLAGAAAYVFSEQRAEDAATQTIAGLESSMQRTASIALYAHDEPLMQEVVGGLARNALALNVTLTDAKGMTLAESRVAAPAGAAVAARPVETALASPFDPGELLGRLHVDVDMRQVHAGSAREARAFALAMAGQSALVALIIYLAAARLISRPIVRIARALAEMRPDEGAQLPVPSHHEEDELGMFVRSINGLLRDSSLALQRERALRDEIAVMGAQYRQIFDSTSAGIFVLDGDGHLINANPTMLRLTGREVHDADHLRGRPFIGGVFTRPDRFRDMIEKAALRRETVSADLELLVAGGASRWSHCLVSVRGGARSGATSMIVEGVLYDITERKRLESAVRQEADRDGLTRALSRAATERAIDRLVLQADRQKGFTLMYVDLDGFKNVNDTLGHAVGDSVLQALVERLHEGRRDADLVGRIGGDEFVVILTDTADDAPVAGLADDVLRRLCQPVPLTYGRSVTLGASIGLAQFPRHGGSREELLHAADEAMYAVKRHGKNGIATAIGHATREPAAVD